MIVSNASFGCPSCPALGDGDVGGGGGGTGSLTRTGQLVVAVCLGVIGTLGFLNNFIVITLFCRYRTLRSPINCMLVSISVSDLLVSVLGTPFSFAASAQGRWLIGRSGCVWYGFVNACLGIVSLITLAVLSYERLCTILGTAAADSRSYSPALLGICFSWLYAVAWTVPPLLGWSSYGPEGPGVSCSVDWRTQTANNVSYILCLFLFCLVLPFAVILYCYGRLLLAVRQVSRVSTPLSRRREQRVLLMVVTMVSCYLLCWLPYGVVALLSTFGPRDAVGPVVSVVPSLLAKSSTVVNPIIYIFMNKQFYRFFRAFLSCSVPQRGSSYKTSRSVHTGRRGNNKTRQFSGPPQSLAPPTHPSDQDTSERANHVPAFKVASQGSTGTVARPKVNLVAYYRE
ncbi:teleost multiple tissue opsin b [Gadus chalcogrammus]|uniref:teleost multiple tissue opsin b n=1 Tax=Gadus chalcogrammus TaxID=1042646 RepID=UPI0024C4AD80|nr:teleost multiple tissue opsin b [Gadus chalcogrammus]